MGKEVEINYVQLNSYLQLKASKKMCAALLNVSEDTIERRIRKLHDMTFRQYQDTQLAPVKLKLVNKAIDMAVNGNVVMLIFCLKNLCGWGDDVESRETYEDETDFEEPTEKAIVVECK